MDFKRWEKVSRSLLTIKRSRTGLGLFAARAIEKDTRIIEYTGKLLTTAQSNEKGGRYLFTVNSRWTVDGTTRRNIARYMNHSCRPNCEPEIENKHIFMYARKNIKAGEELTYNYGKEYVDEFIKPHGCKCSVC